MSLPLPAWFCVLQDRINQTEQEIDAIETQLGSMVSLLDEISRVRWVETSFCDSQLWCTPDATFTWHCLLMSKKLCGSSLHTSAWSAEPTTQGPRKRLHDSLVLIRVHAQVQAQAEVVAEATRAKLNSLPQGDFEESDSELERFAQDFEQVGGRSVRYDWLLLQLLVRQRRTVVRTGLG
jgi:hypothetical protein